MSSNGTKNTLTPEEQAKRLSDLRIKEFEVKAVKIDRDFSRIVQEQEKRESLKKLNIFSSDDKYIEVLAERSKQKFANAKKKMRLLGEVPELSELLPFYSGELFLVGARTGTGKSTFALNVAYSLLLQNKRPLVITNEEDSVDYLNRMAGLFISKRYGGLDKIDEETKNRLLDLFPKIASRLQVIDASYAINNGVNLPNLTNTVEGLEYIVNKLLQEQANGTVFDAVIIDYYQKVNSSIANPDMDVFECQARAAEIIERLRVSYRAPIVLLAQMEKGGGEDPAPFERRIQGRKVIVNFATVVFELVVNRELRATEVLIHKARNTDIPSEKILLGWVSPGKYVEYNEEFARSLAKAKMDKIMSYSNPLLKKKDEE